MKDPKLSANNYLYCQVPTHQDCELNTLCSCSVCPNRGLICYLCSFVKPHIEHSKQDIIPIRLIKKEKNMGQQRPGFIIELEIELKSKQKTHLNALHKTRVEILHLLDQYEQKVNSEFFALQEKLLIEEEDLFERINNKNFSDQVDFERTTEKFLKRLVRRETETRSPRWVYSEDNTNYLEVVHSIKASISEFQTNLMSMKENLLSVVSDSLCFSPLSMNIDELIDQLTNKKSGTIIRECSLSTCRTSESSEACNLTMFNHPSPVKPESYPDEDQTRQRTRPMTFGRKNDNDEEISFLDNILEESADKENIRPLVTPENIQKSDENKETVFENVFKINKKYEAASIPTQQNADFEFVDDIGDYMIIKDSIVETEYRPTLIESDWRFITGKGEATRLVRKPDEKFDALTFYSKVTGTVLEGFGFYCPIPCEGTRLDLEYRVYEGTQKGGKEVMREFVSFDCDVHSLKENTVTERMLLKVPLKLAKKKWYTVVLCYLNQVKVGWQEMKWRDVGPFMFMGLEKRQVKEWLGMKTMETEKMYTSQFPYLIYSD